MSLPLPPAYMTAVPWDDVRRQTALDLQMEVSRWTPCHITWDQRRDHYDTFLRNLVAAGAGPALFLEDDIALTSDWGSKVADAIDSHPGHLIQFYSNRKADVEVGSRMEPGRTYLNNQCWYVPAGMVRPLATFIAQWHGRAKDPTGSDLAVAQFLQSNGLKYWLHVPSLVQHLGLPSAIDPKRPAHLRQSRTYQP